MEKVSITAIIAEKIMSDSVKNSTQEKKQAKTEQNSPKEAELQANRTRIDQAVAKMPKEHGGRPKDKGLEPTRYGDWEFKGRCIDF